MTRNETLQFNWEVPHIEYYQIKSTDEGNLPMSLGEKLKQIRVKKGLSQASVGEHLNLTRQTISKWENDNGYPDLDNLVRLSEYYEVSIDELLKRPQDLEKKTEEETSKVALSQAEENTQQNPDERDEGLILLLISLVGCLVTPLGLIIAPLVLKRNKATNTFCRGVKVASVVCILINFWGLYGFLSTTFHWGVTTTVEYLGE